MRRQNRRGEIAIRGHRMVSMRLVLTSLLGGCAALPCGCNSILNGWLDPSVLGSFSRIAVNEIRTSLTLEDTPSGIVGAEYPTQDDLRVVVREYPLSAGDTLSIQIYELRRRLETFQVQAQVTTSGLVNLPVVGRVHAAELTVLEFEEAVATALRDRNILLDPEVTVTALTLQKATYSIYGVGVSASNTAPLRAGVFPIRRPDLRLLEAINQVGGLNEFVTEIYVFRTEDPLEVSPGEAEQVEGEEDTSGRFPEAAVLDVVLAEEEAQQEGIDRDLAQAPEPGPWTYVNGEFIENPAYQGEEGASSQPPAALPLDTVTPMVNWARLAGESTYRILHIPAGQLRAGNPEVNIVVRAGDVIRIVSGEIGRYYVMGQVNRAGAFAFNAEAITLKAAIAAAGGLSSLAWPDRCTVYRRLGQREQMIQVDLDRVFAGKDPDFYVKRGDIINVGTHPLAPFLQRIRAWTLPNPASNVGYSFSYARNFADIDSFGVRRNPHNEPDRFPGLFP